MGRRKVSDAKSAKPIRGPGRKSRKQGEPTFPKELTETGTNRSDRTGANLNRALL